MTALSFYHVKMRAHSQGSTKKLKLLPCRYFNEFLMGHHRQVAREIKDEYVDTISKVYFSYFKAYISKLTKLQVRID